MEYIILALVLIIAVLCVVVIISLNKLSKKETTVDLTEPMDKLDKLKEEMIALKQASLISNESQGSSFKLMRDEISESLARSRRQDSENSLLLMEEQRKQIGALNEAMRVGLGEIKTATETSLNKIQGVVDEKLTKTLNDRLDSNFKQIAENLGELYKSLGELSRLSSGVADLNRTLSNVKTRGVWGEHQLSAILEQTMTPAQYDTNVITKRGSNDRVEFAVKIPTKGTAGEFTYMPIDSKFPSDIYNRLYAAADATDREALDTAVKELEQRIKLEAKSISTKYIDPPNTTDMAVMFLPTEGLYAEVLRIDGLSEWCQTNCHVFITGPTTVTAFLNSLRVGFANVALNEKSKEVLKLLEAVKAQYATFASLIDQTQKRLSMAMNSTDELKKRSDMIQRKMKGISEITSDESDRILGIESFDE